MRCTGANIDKLAAIKKLTMLLNMPFIMVGDWNMEPPVLLQSGWVQEVGGTILVPQVPFTCSKASGALLDFVVASAQALHLIQSIEVDAAGTWRPHSGLRIALSGSPKDIRLLQLRKPRKLQIADCGAAAIAQAWESLGGGNKELEVPAPPGGAALNHATFGHERCGCGS